MYELDANRAKLPRLMTFKRRALGSDIMRICESRAARAKRVGG